MKSFSLSEDQKTKLLEMCTKLFTEYKHIQLTDGACDFCLESTLLLSKDINPKHNSWILIHWFEFCITHLCTAIGNSESTSDNFDETTLRGDMYFTMEWGRNNHPVDYLYEEFKKLT